MTNPWWQEAVALAGGLGLTAGAAVKWLPGMVRYVLGASERRDKRVNATATSRETDASAGLIRAETDGLRMQTAGDMFDLLTKTWKREQDGQASRLELTEKLETATSDLARLKQRVDDLDKEQRLNKDRIVTLLEELGEEQKLRGGFEDRCESLTAENIELRTGLATATEGLATANKGLATANERITVLEGQVRVLTEENTRLRGGGA